MNNNAQINIGIIGPGRVAARHALALQKLDNARLWSITGRNLDDTKQFAKEYQAQAPLPFFIDITEMLADEQLDAVIIATRGDLRSPSKESGLKLISTCRQQVEPIKFYQDSEVFLPRTCESNWSLYC